MLILLTVPAGTLYCNTFNCVLAPLFLASNVSAPALALTLNSEFKVVFLLIAAAKALPSSVAVAFAASAVVPYSVPSAPTSFLPVASNVNVTSIALVFPLESL